MAETTSSSAAAAAAKSKPAGMKKSEAIWQALKDLGKDAKPVQIQGHIKKKFNIEISTNHISAAKTDILRRMAKEKKAAPATPAAKPAAKPAPKKPTPATSAKPAVSASNGKAISFVSMADVATIKELVRRVGTPNLKTVIELVGRLGSANLKSLIDMLAK